MKIVTFFYQLVANGATFIRSANFVFQIVADDLGIGVGQCFLVELVELI